MNREQLKIRAVESIEARKDELIAIGRALFAMPETGFREHKSAAYVKKVLMDLGLEVCDGLALTGLRAVAKGRSRDYNVGVMGELDALVMPQHPHADPQSGYAHACGHHAQVTCMLGTAFGLVATDIMKELDGDLTLFAVPAEEVVELSFRKGLHKEGKIKFFGGKQEFIRLGVVDDVDVVLCSHLTGANAPQPFFDHSKSYNGKIHKVARFIGKSAHAALSPQLGINALHAAVCAINNINALRDTFQDADHVRVHYIISKGGDSPNIVPDDVQLDLGVRASTTQMLFEANIKVNRALRSGAEAIGAQVDIEDLGGYLPLHQNRPLGLLYAENAKSVVGPDNVFDLITEARGSSTDAGDLASIKPTIHPNFGGAMGAPHTNSFVICDEYAAYVQPAKVAAMTVIDLLYDGAKEGKRIRDSYVPTFSNKEEYCTFFDKLRQ